MTRAKFEIINRKLNQFEIAQQIGMNNGTLSLILNGRLIPTTEQRIAIKEALEWPGPIDDLFKEVTVR